MIEYEKKGFASLRDGQGNEVPLYRITPLKYAEENNQGPFLADEKRSGKRRIPRNAPPLVDFLLEAYRGLYYSKFPSRHFALFANLNDYQTRYLKDDTRLYKVIPHKTAAVSISGIVDFRVSNPELIYDFVRKGLKAEHITGQDADLKELLKYDGKAAADDSEYVAYHKVLEELMTLPVNGRAGKLGQAFLELLKEYHDSSVEALEPIVSFWENSELVENLIFSGRGMENEVVIQGPVYYVEVEPWK